jgi:hypothetical protein
MYILDLVNELVVEARKYYEYPPYNKASFKKNFPEKMLKEWESDIEGLKERIKYYKYLNRNKH